MGTRQCSQVSGVYLNRKTIFQGKFVRHGGRNPGGQWIRFRRPCLPFPGRNGPAGGGRGIVRLFAS